jgi:hypothetical protein
MSKKETSEMYLRCITEMAKDLLSGKETKPAAYCTVWHVSTNIPTCLVRLGYLKKTGRKYTWVGRVPDETMVIEVRNAQADLFKKSQEAATQLSIPMTLLDRKVANKRKSRKIPIDQVWGIFMRGVELAKKYGVPEEKWRDFVNDVYYFRG